MNLEKEGTYYLKKKLKKIPNKLLILTKDTIDLEAMRLLMIKNKSNWTKDTEAFYRDRIVKEIMMISYNHKSDVDIKELKKH